MPGSPWDLLAQQQQQPVDKQAILNMIQQPLDTVPYDVPIPKAQSDAAMTPEDFTLLKQKLQSQQNQTPQAVQPVIPPQAPAEPAQAPVNLPTLSPGKYGETNTKTASTPKNDYSGIQDMINNVNVKSNDSLKQQGVSIQGLKDQLSGLNSKELPMDLTPFASLVDNWTGSHFTNSYKPSETAESRQATVNKLQDAILKAENNLSGNEVDTLKSQLSNQLGLTKLQSEDQQRQEANSIAWAKINADKGKESKDTSKEFERLGHDLVSGTASSRSDFGKNQITITSAKKIEALGEQAKTQTGGLTPNQIHELALASGALVSNGNAATENTVKALVPKDKGMNAASIEQWLTDKPTGANQQAFVNQMLETAGRERTLAEENLKGIKSDILAGHVGLDQQDPRYTKLIDHHFGKDSQFDSFGNYIPKAYGANKAPAGKVHLVGNDGKTYEFDANDSASIGEFKKEMGTK
jgi:hypothetical protein